MPLSALDLDAGWLDYARANGIGRRVPLWPETVAALREVIAKRKPPADPADADVVFVTKYGQRWVRYSILETKSFGKISIKPKQDDAIAKETAKLLRELGIKRHGVGFLLLAATCLKPWQANPKDPGLFTVLTHSWGNVDNTMAGEYREHIAQTIRDAGRDGDGPDLAVRQPCPGCRVSPKGVGPTAGHYRPLGVPEDSAAFLFAPLCIPAIYRFAVLLKPELRQAPIARKRLPEARRPFCSKASRHNAKHRQFLGQFLGPAPRPIQVIVAR